MTKGVFFYCVMLQKCRQGEGSLYKKYIDYDCYINYLNHDNYAV